MPNLLECLTERQCAEVAALVHSRPYDMNYRRALAGAPAIVGPFDKYDAAMVYLAALYNHINKEAGSCCKQKSNKPCMTASPLPSLANGGDSL